MHGDHVSFWFSHSLLKMFVLSYSILFSCTSPRMPRTPQLGLAVNMGGDDRTSAARLGQVSLPQILAIFGADSQWFAHRNTKENERKRERETKRIPREYKGKKWIQPNQMKFSIFQGLAGFVLGVILQILQHVSNKRNGVSIRGTCSLKSSLWALSGYLCAPRDCQVQNVL